MREGLKNELKEKVVVEKNAQETPEWRRKSRGKIGGRRGKVGDWRRKNG